MGILFWEAEKDLFIVWCETRATTPTIVQHFFIVKQLETNTEESLTIIGYHLISEITWLPLDQLSLPTRNAVFWILTTMNLFRQNCVS